MEIERRLQIIFQEVLEEVARNPRFARRIEHALDIQKESLSAESKDQAQGARRARRSAGILDPFKVYEEGEKSLRAALGSLDTEQLKDIIAEQRMDPSRLAMKWRSRERLVDLIVSSVTSRFRKGDAFRGEWSPDEPEH